MECVLFGRLSDEDISGGEWLLAVVGGSLPQLQESVAMSSEVRGYIDKHVKARNATKDENKDCDSEWKAR